jgi:hypothetical protein
VVLPKHHKGLIYLRTEGIQQFIVTTLLFLMKTHCNNKLFPVIFDPTANYHRRGLITLLMLWHAWIPKKTTKPSIFKDLNLWTHLNLLIIKSQINGHIAYIIIQAQTVQAMQPEGWHQSITTTNKMRMHDDRRPRTTKKESPEWQSSRRK